MVFEITSLFKINVSSMDKSARKAASRNIQIYDPYNYEDTTTTTNKTIPTTYVADPKRDVWTYASWGSVGIAVLIIIISVGVIAFLYFTGRSPFGPIEPDDPIYVYPYGKESTIPASTATPLTEAEKEKIISENKLTPNS